MIGSLTSDMERWRELFDRSPPLNISSNTEFSTLHRNIQGYVRRLNVDIGDLGQTVKIVTDNRIKFRDITDAELDSRRKFVADTKVLVDDCEETMKSQRTRARVERDHRESLFTRETEVQRSGKEKEREREGNEFLEDRRQAQVMVEARQDLMLDDMSAALGRLGDVATAIHVEVQQQNVAIQELDSDVDDAQDRMNSVLRKINKLLGQSDSGRLLCILFLVIIAIVMIIAIVYT